MDEVDQRMATGLRIGELSRRVGVSEHVLRAWESRYGLLRPARSPGGYRLYSRDDENRVRQMQAHLAGGLAAAQAAGAAIAELEPPLTTLGGNVPKGGHSSSATSAHPASRPELGDPLSSADRADYGSALLAALDGMDEPKAHAVLDRLLTEFTIDSVLRDVVMPYLSDLGARWEAGEVSVAQEHFATEVVRGRLAGLARGWGGGRGPQALLACPPGELHDMGLLVFGIALSRRGWRIANLGVNTPVPQAREVTSDLSPALVVMAATTSARFTAIEPELTRLAALVPLALAGAGATQDLAESIGARLLAGDPVTAAEQLAGSWP
jgi:methanogenic corrinoid protein MtbC1